VINLCFTIVELTVKKIMGTVAAIVARFIAASGFSKGLLSLTRRCITAGATFVKWTFAGKDGEIITALCISFQAIKQLEDKLSTTRASIVKCFPLPIWISNSTFPTHPNGELFAVTMGSLPHILYFIFALSNKHRKMIVLDVPVSGKAIHELNLSSVSNARNCKSTSGVGVFFGGQLRLDVAVAYDMASDSESEYWIIFKNLKMFLKRKKLRL
jgi:hypothetical protein